MRVTWAGLKRMRVVASVVVHRAEDRAAVAARLRDRLDRVLSPVPVGTDPGWPFGEYLRVARVYDVLQAERGVRYVSDVKLVVEDIPEAVSAIVRDPHQPKTWFCGSGSSVFRTVDHATGWVVAAAFADEQVEHLAVLRGAPGCVVAVSRTWCRRVQRGLRLGRLRRDVGADRASSSSMSSSSRSRSSTASPHAFLATDQGLFRQPLAEARRRPTG